MSDDKSNDGGENGRSWLFNPDTVYDDSVPEFCTQEYISGVTSVVRAWLDEHSLQIANKNYLQLSLDYKYAAEHLYTRLVFREKEIAAVHLLAELSSFIACSKKDVKSLDITRMIEICTEMYCGTPDFFFQCVSNIGDWSTTFRMIVKSSAHVESEIIELIRTRQFIRCAQAIILYKAKVETQDELERDKKDEKSMEVEA